MANNRHSEVIIETGKLLQFECTGPSRLTVDGLVYGFNDSVKIEEAAGGAFYITPLDWEYSYMGVRLRGTFFIYPGGLISGNLAMEMELKTENSPDYTSIKMTIGRTVNISHEGLITWEGYVEDPDGALRRKVTFSRNLATDPV